MNWMLKLFVHAINERNPGGAPEKPFHLRFLASIRRGWIVFGSLAIGSFLPTIGTIAGDADAGGLEFFLMVLAAVLCFAAMIVWSLGAAILPKTEYQDPPYDPDIYLMGRYVPVHPEREAWLLMVAWIGTGILILAAISLVLTALYLLIA